MRMIPLQRVVHPTETRDAYTHPRTSARSRARSSPYAATATPPRIRSVTCAGSAFPETVALSRAADRDCPPACGPPDTAAAPAGTVGQRKGELSSVARHLDSATFYRKGRHLSSIDLRGGQLRHRRATAAAECYSAAPERRAADTAATVSPPHGTRFFLTNIFLLLENATANPLATRAPPHNSTPAPPYTHSSAPPP
jgi:hypothetical protein